MASNINLSVGIDIGGTNTVIGLVDAEGHVVCTTSFPTPKHGDIDNYVNDIRNAIVKLTTEQKVGIKGIGICAPNANYYTGNIEYAPNLSFKGIVPLVTLLKNAMPEVVNIVMTNDANAAAMGEMIYGGAKGMKNFVMITLGTGVGSGIVVDGKIVYGCDGFAGEVGHTMLVPGGRMCGCGIRGHLEAYCSTSGIKRTAFELLAEYNETNSLLSSKSYAELTSKDIHEAAIAGDEIAIKALAKSGEYLAQGLADTIHHTSPEAIFLFGGPVGAGDYILTPLRNTIDKYLLPVFRGKAQILVSALKSGEAAIVGAAALVQ